MNAVLQTCVSEGKSLQRNSGSWSNDILFIDQQTNIFAFLSGGKCTEYWRMKGSSYLALLC